VAAGLIVIGTLVAIAAVSIVDGDRAEAADGNTGSLRFRIELALARLATFPYHQVDEAVADGYVPIPPCTDMPDGEMHVVHYLNLSLVDDRVRAWEPEGLLYRPDSEGRLQLAGVGYIKPDVDGDPATDDDRPTLFDVPFAGPMPAHHGLPLHYHLHAWIWSRNPDGMFADSCH
jgi:hypothetical protein